VNNPFDSQDIEFSVLVNAEGQHSLWPAFAGLPDGWTPAFGPADRRSCLGYVNEHWTDLRPRSVAAAIDAAMDAA
jgi:MbtH protein